MGTRRDLLKLGAGHSDLNNVQIADLVSQFLKDKNLQ